MKANEKTENIRSRKLPAIKLHLFLRVEDSDYLLTLTTKHTLSLRLFRHQQVETFENQTAIPTENPIDLMAGNNQDVYLLCKEGIFMWYLDQIKAKASPKKMYCKWPAEPLKLLHITNSQFVVICSNQTLLFVKNGEITKQMTYPIQLAMVKLVISYSRTKEQNSLILVPSSSKKLPYIFKLNEVPNWKYGDFFKEYLNQCQQYYLQDQVLSEETDIFCFSAALKLAYACLSKQLIVLEIKQVALHNISYVLKAKITLKMQWSQCPLSCAVNEETGSFIYVGVERIGECNPTKYTTTTRSIKQRKLASELITEVSCTKHGQIVMLSPSSITQSKFYVCKMDETP